MVLEPDHQVVPTHPTASRPSQAREAGRVRHPSRPHSSEIGGALHCRGALLRNPSGPALDAEGLRTGGDLVIDDGFTATGAIRLVVRRD